MTSTLRAVYSLQKILIYNFDIDVIVQFWLVDNICIDVIVQVWLVNDKRLDVIVQFWLVDDKFVAKFVQFWLVDDICLDQRFPSAGSWPGTGSRKQTAGSPKYFYLIFNFIIMLWNL